MSGCPEPVLEALLRCSTANLGTAPADDVDVDSIGYHHRYNHSTNADTYDLGLGDGASLKAPPFRNGSVYESATGMEIGGRTGSETERAGTGHHAAAITDSQRETLKSINRSLRNVAWELTQDQPGSASIKNHVNVGEEGEVGKIGEMSASVVHRAPAHESFEKETERKCACFSF